MTMRRMRLHLIDEIGARDVLDASVKDCAADRGKTVKEIERFASAVGSDDVELGGFDDELASGDAAGKFAVDDEKTGSIHGCIRCNFARAERMGRKV
jgi:hypothetical protein